MDLIGSLRFSLAIDAFNRRSPSSAFRPFFEPIRKGGSGSKLPVRQAVGEIAVLHYVAVSGASRDRVLTVARLAAAREPRMTSE
jgi:hypothetical protein